ncbi:phospholipase D-like domain-containing protein, partial [Mycobacterium avium subsp. paratuberculosis]
MLVQTGRRRIPAPGSGVVHSRMPALLTPGQTCWRTARADRFAAIIDAADYFRHVKAAMLRARHRI